MAVACTAPQGGQLLVEGKLIPALLHVGLVTPLKILRKNHVAVLAHLHNTTRHMENMKAALKLCSQTMLNLATALLDEQGPVVVLAAHAMLCWLVLLAALEQCAVYDHHMPSCTC